MKSRQTVEHIIDKPVEMEFNTGRAMNAEMDRTLESIDERLKELELEITASSTPTTVKNAIHGKLGGGDGPESPDRAWMENRDKWREKLRAGHISKLKFHRLVNNLSQTELASRLGTRQPNIARIERPGYRASASTLRKLSRVYNVSVEELRD